MDTFSNRSVFISLRFQIDPLWIPYLNVCVFMIVFIVSVQTRGEPATISLRSQMKTYPCNRGLRVPVLKISLKK